MSKTIEIENSDTFFRSDSGSVGIQRGSHYRWISDPNWYSATPGSSPITRAEFETIAGICGYTVVEAAPPMHEVVVTHQVCDSNKTLMHLGTKESCEGYIKARRGDHEWTITRLRFGGAK